jgi:hypothetical protein
MSSSKSSKPESNRAPAPKCRFLNFCDLLHDPGGCKVCPFAGLRPREDDEVVRHTRTDDLCEP